jgi:hypothetical protein
MKGRTNSKANGLAEALAELHAGRLNAAEDLSRRLLASAPETLRCINCRQQSPCDEEISKARRVGLALAWRTDRDHAPALVIAGRAARASGDLTEALVCFRRAAELSPTRPEPAFMTCVTLLERGDAEAHEMLKR